MSRVGKAEISIPKGVSTKVAGRVIEVKGPKGTLQHSIHPQIAFEITESTVSFTRPSNEPAIRALHGTSRAIVANMVKGVSEGFTKTLEIVGVGYRGEQKGNGINFLLGYSHPVEFVPPAGITVKMDGTNKVVISGADKHQVGHVAALIRSYRSPEPYKGKGVRYSDEVVRRKEVKKS